MAITKERLKELIKQKNQQIAEIRKPLEEPSREECEIVELCGQVECSKCNHIFTDETLTFDEEYECPDDGYEFYKANYCPHCGAKIKRGKKMSKKEG